VLRNAFGRHCIIGSTGQCLGISRMIHHAATASDDDLLVATAAYVRTETFFANGQLAIGRRLLELAAEAIDPTRSERDAATYGSIHMRAAVVAAKEFRSDIARAHLTEASRAARYVPENIYLGTGECGYARPSRVRERAMPAPLSG